VSASEAGLSENFTPRAQRVLGFAREEASLFNDKFVGPEHVLLGLMKLGGGVAFNVLQKQGIDYAGIRLEIGNGNSVVAGEKEAGNIPFTPSVKRALSFALEEAKALNHTYVGTEHVLLGLIREGDGVAAKVLQGLGIDPKRVRHEIMKELDPHFPPQS
jgi:ATP-dependent Clp protease ATP-binding subunit ClpC